MIPFRVAPCKECDKHTDDCHGKCEAYKTWYTEYGELKNKIHANKNKDVALEIIRVDSITRKKRRKK